MEDVSLKSGGGLAQAVRQAYAQGQQDYNLKPLVRMDQQGNAIGRIKPGDTVVFCCRRGEREIELTEMFTDPNFSAIDRVWLDDLSFVTFTRYHEKFAYLPTVFAPEAVAHPLSKALADAGRTQLHCAESEKYAHVTFFLNGGSFDRAPGEVWFGVPSPRGPHELVPELSARELTDALIGRIGETDFVVVNYANGDIIGHTESIEAKVTAVRCVSEQLERLTSAALEKDYVVLVTADHGNIEIMTKQDGTHHVSHTTSLVPFIVADRHAKEDFPVLDGALCDIGPTVLSIMGIKPPPSMTGKNLVPDHDFGENRKVLLVILDGWGIGKEDETNAIHVAQAREWNAFAAAYPHSALHASGEHVGLLAGKSGNSEAGHTNIGAGRVVMQDDRRIEDAMLDGSLEKNPVLIEAVKRARTRGSALHLIGLLSENSSHGSIAYPLAVCRMAEGMKDVYLHLIVDGRSTAQGSTPGKVMDLAQRLKKIGTGQIVGCVGRGYALDRAGNYDKVKAAYDAMVLGEGVKYLDVLG